MKPKVILVHPPMYLKSLYGDLAEAGNELPPQGLCSLAAVLREKGFQPVIIDATAEKLNLRETLNRIRKDLPALLIGFSVYYVSEEAVSLLAKSLKKINPNIPIVVGGGHMTMCAEQVMKRHPEFDVAVIGEGEQTIVSLTKTLQKKKDIALVKGIIFRKKVNMVRTLPQPFIKNLDSLPFPAWDLLPELTKNYIPAGDSLKRWPSTGLVTSRGCPGNCFFCNKNAFGSIVRQNSPEYVIDEIKNMQLAFGIKDIYFQDDTFVANRDWVINFCRLLIKEKLDLTWACHARTNLVDLPLLRLMKRAGCWQISFGIESGSQKVLNAINKQITVSQHKKALKMCQKTGIAVKGLFMVGSFGETQKTLQETKRFIKENYLTDFHATFFTVIPGTMAEKIWPRFGKILKSKTPPMMTRPSFIPVGLTKSNLKRAQKQFLLSFYLQPRIFWYFFKKLGSLHIRKKIFESVLALARYSLARNY